MFKNIDIQCMYKVILFYKLIIYFYEFRYTTSFYDVRVVFIGLEKSYKINLLMLHLASFCLGC